MGIFAGTGRASSSSPGKNGDRLPGDFTGILEVVKARAFTSKVGSDTWTVIDAKVVMSDKDDWPDGRMCSVLTKMNDQWGYGISDMKSFAKAAVGAEDKDIDEDFMDALFADDGEDLAGLQFVVETDTIITKKGGEHTKHYFSAVPE